MVIRPETANDYGAIRDLLVKAFANHPYSHQTEHLIVEALRSAGALTAALVAERHGTVAGHIAFSPANINSCDWNLFALGPIAVLPEFQRQGIGRKLIEEGLKLLCGQGAHGCVLVGDPAFYTRFGFQHNPMLTLKGVPPEVLMSMTMVEPCPRGEISLHPAALSMNSPKRLAAA